MNRPRDVLNHSVGQPSPAIGSVYGGEYGGRQGLTFLARGSRRALAGFDASLGRNENTVVVCVGLGTWSPGS